MASGVVTGAAGGIGAAIAERLADAGASILLLDADGEKLTRRFGERSGASGNVELAQIDVRDEAALGSVIDTFAAGRSLDFLVASAGISGEGRATEVTQERWETVIGVNLTGVWLSASHVARHMEKSGGGSIVMISSVAGAIGLPGVAAYSAAKGGVIALARQMARDYAGADIRVNAICPGPIPTDLVTTAYAARGISLDVAAAQVPLGRLGSTDDVAALAELLVGPRGAWITGEAIAVDGGMSHLVAGAPAS